VRAFDRAHARMLAPMMRLFAAGSCVAFTVAIAASGCRPQPSDTAGPPAPAPVDHEATRATMQRHFEEVSAIRDAVIDGELDTVHELADAFATEQRSATNPEAWQPHVLEMIEVAAAAAQAPDMPTAAAATARLAASCGHCHRAVGAHPVFADAVEPDEEDESVASSMQRHQWAADRLWEGIVGPSELAWARGSETFPALPGCPLDVDTEPDFEPRMAELCDRVGILGREGATTRAPEDRTRIYGELLATCAACHTTGA
jgi:mono/diheme cytochrome c family protein